MDSNMEFPDGIFAKAPAGGAPDFVKGKVNFKLKEAIPWLKAKEESGEEWLSLDIKEGRSGKWYAAVNTWKPKNVEEPVQDDDMPW